ncbi:hypothetical protein BY996DRAFT_6409865 [Phakopsora pachyrhizi]|uniref:Expressed protein n=1 Tax=Phakopsora pachyrhizi TaxID=170000 RepID=A0A0S1MJW2_PHAPC|nr:hypothetical protein BY996DRAFT_6409865 [Phakopsora pachyrhizi]CAH7675022.1 expressed protein [Phakopsora pachyrhizi]
MSFAKQVLLSICFFAVFSKINALTVAQPSVRCLGDTNPAAIKAEDCDNAMSQFSVDSNGYIQYDPQGEKRDFGSCRIQIQSTSAASNLATINPEVLKIYISTGLTSCNGGTSAIEPQGLVVNVIKL